MIKAIIFDLGNVLINFDARKSSKAFSEALGVDEMKLWEDFFISELERKYTRGEISSRDFYEQVSSLYPKKLDYETFAKYWNEIFWENSGMAELLERLGKRYPLFLISNTNELHFDYLKLQFAHVLKHFKKLFPSHEVGVRKPDPKVFERVLAETGVRPDETVFIDDVPMFVEGARSIGMQGIHFTSKEALEGKLRALGVQC